MAFFSFITALSIIVSLSINPVQSQVVLKYETHGFINDTKNEIHLTDVVNPGESGKNAYWDFSSLKINEDFVGKFSDAGLEPDRTLFPEANIIIEEFGNRFFFKSDSESTRQYGYISKEGNAIEYTKPYKKMRYPFSFGESFSGDFEAKLNSGDGEYVPISGSYSVVADAEGKLGLPGNILYDNALRVKEVKTSKQLVEEKLIHVEHTAYRWYVAQHRFPVLTIVNSKWIYPDGDTHSYSLTGYNPVIVYHATDITEKPEQSVTYSVYPNPYRDFVSIRLFVDEPSDVEIAVYCQNGKRIKEIASNNSLQGEIQHTFSAKNLGLGPGVYFVRFIVNNQVKTLKILEI